ncbi:hypothetical protein POVWA2_033440 [Plasmodium ovale wallikeri]|uniref:Uncharacterized protein n=1 Tax=Plasmodium ovale wallikeri TaxID=864142 RepID=A0A1A8YZ18_PLAOA|nr:hypothetical protein POVWA1_034300 [Plasmodium ovale wallikeri]SBT37284.1 hypothetical protein POVWA2_033440 [Plasmodium ovale wallikeri]
MKKEKKMRCAPFSCKSNYYYDPSYFPLSDDEEFDLFFSSKNKKNDLNYMLEKAISEIIYSTKDCCDVNSDFEQVEKIEKKKKKVLYEDDLLDDIDIILKKSENENMFLKKTEHGIKNDDIILPPKNIKKRIYSINEDKEDVESCKKKTNFCNDKILENFKNVLCNDLNKYFKDIIEGVKKRNELYMHNNSNELTDNNISSRKTKHDHSIPLNENKNSYKKSLHYCLNSNHNTENDSFNGHDVKIMNTKNLNYKNVNSNEKKKYNNSRIGKATFNGGKSIPKKKNSKTCDDTINTNAIIGYNKKDPPSKKTYIPYKRTANKSRSRKSIYFSKRKKLTKENLFLLTDGEFMYCKDSCNTYDLRKNISAQNSHYFNESENGLSNVHRTGKGNGLKGLQTTADSKVNFTTSSREDFTFNHFQKNENNDILSKFLS